MKRKIYDNLLHWKRSHKGDTALLIEGVRRIGKSYIVEAFARNEYESYILIDFSKVNPIVHDFFKLYLDELDTLFRNLELYFQQKLHPRKSPNEEARSLIIFDEVQFCPRARAAIKHLVADHRFDYIETGSLVSIKKNVKDIMLPSEEHVLEMFPMDFEEFLWAQGEDLLMPYIQEKFTSCSAMGPFHRRAMDYFRQYMIVGGMPQAVKNYVETHDFERVAYTDAIEILKNSKPNKTGKFQYPVTGWGVDLQSEHERYLVEKHFKKPVILTGYPKEIKAFYMKQNPDGKTVAAMDVLFPQIGEIIGGSQREENLDKLVARMKEVGIPLDSMQYYLDTRRFGSAVHSGFGLGFERLLLFVTGMTNIRDVIPFPRTPKNAEF